MELVSRIFRAPRGSFFLFGPRGTGKSTWLRQSLPEALFIDLLDPEAFRAYVARPERLQEAVDAAPRARQVVIYEVQKAPALLDVVHRLIEDKRRRQVQFVLTGSSARKLKRSGVDLLAGRVVMKTLHPFMAAELGSRFDLRRSLELGLLPLVLNAQDPRETLNSYVSLYLREEVQAEGLVRNIGHFSRFLEAISLSHASTLNTSEVARECQVGRKAVEGSVEVLEHLLLGFRLQPFTQRARRQITQHPKFYYADVGIFRSVRPRGPLDAPEEIGGAAIEGLVAQHLRAWVAYGKGDEQLYYWRTKAGLEVDFVVYGSRVFAAIEVKRSTRISGTDLKALRAFREDYPQARAYLLYGGRERLKMDEIMCLPIEDFLRGLVPDSSLVTE